MKRNKKIIGFICVLLSMLLIVACSPGAEQTNREGRAVFILTDAAADMGAVTRVTVTIDSVSVLTEGGAWTKVNTKQQTYDLLALKASGTQVLLADYNLTPGVYRQMRLEVSRVIVTDASGDHTAKMPSGELKLVGKLVVNENSTSTARFDFIADESLHVTGNGTYIFAPVIQLETREKAHVEIKSSADFKTIVLLKDGKINENIKLSMDVKGNVGEGLMVRKESKLSVVGDAITEESVLSAS